MKIKFDQVPLGTMFIEQDTDLLCVKICETQGEVDGSLRTVFVNPDDDVEINPEDAP